MTDGIWSAQPQRMDEDSVDFGIWIQSAAALAAYRSSLKWMVIIAAALIPAAAISPSLSMAIALCLLAPAFMGLRAIASFVSSLPLQAEQPRTKGQISLVLLVASLGLGAIALVSALNQPAFFVRQPAFIFWGCAAMLCSFGSTLALMSCWYTTAFELDLQEATRKCSSALKMSYVFGASHLLVAFIGPPLLWLSGIASIVFLVRMWNAAESLERGLLGDTPLSV